MLKNNPTFDTIFLLSALEGREEHTILLNQLINNINPLEYLIYIKEKYK